MYCATVFFFRVKTIISPAQKIVRAHLEKKRIAEHKKRGLKAPLDT